jgi:hypothetical protein
MIGRPNDSVLAENRSRASMGDIAESQGAQSAKIRLLRLKNSWRRSIGWKWQAFLPIG